MMRAKPFLAMLLLLATSATSRLPAQEATTEPAEVPPARVSAREAVRQGNELLRAGDAAGALRLYDQAKALAPDAPEIAFVEGLGHFHQQDFAAARESFERAAVARDDALAQAAQYSAGTALHAEALASEADPKIAIEKLEGAMQRYQSVLAAEPEHDHARDGLRKAASMRRLLKQRMEQQQQQQSQDGDSNEEQEEQENQDKQEQQGDQQQEQESSENQEQSSEQAEQDEQQQSDQQESNDQQKQSEQQSESDQEQQAEQQSGEEQKQDEQEQKESKESTAEAEERNSREQAERRLREMMQHVRSRQKQRQESGQRVPIVPVDKDW